MRKLLAAGFLLIGLIAKSQNLLVEGTAPNLYITHTVAPKENFYSISRLYNAPPKSIAALNNIAMEKGLTIGQHVKIPLNVQSIDATESARADATHLKLTRVVTKSETLFKIGTDLHVTAQSIRKWNKLSSDKIAPGTHLVVGFLKTNDTEPFAAAAKTNTVASADKAPVQKNAETEKPAANETKKEDSSISGIAGTDRTNSKKQARPTGQDDNSQSAKTSQVNADPPAGIAQKDTALAVIPEASAAAPAKEEPVKQQETAVSKNEENKKTTQESTTGSISNGTFEELYNSNASQKTENTKSGEAATFKSTSGWQDKKYYVLMNDVAAGTIVKISTDNKSVYAKVLGSMPEMKENTGLLLRVSNAAASYLGIIDPKFPVQVSYY